MRWTPHGYQKKAMKFIVQRMSAGLFLDPGLGKTSITYGAFKGLRKAGMVEKMLVVSPLRPATSTWPREAMKWDDFKELNVHVLHGEGKQELLEQPHDVSIINPEGLPWLLGYKNDKEKWVRGAAKEAGVWWDMLAIDESTRFKNSGSLRFKTLRPWLPKLGRRVILTGSPAPNGLMDLFGQVYLLDFGRSLGEFITRFRSKYFDPVGFGSYNYRIKDGAEEQIYKALKPYVLRMSAEDYLDLPELFIPEPTTVELPPKARKIYDQMENLLLAEMEAGIVTASNAATATTKCRQIASGGMFVDGDGNWEHVHDAKTEAVVSLVEELNGTPLLLGYEYQHDLARLRKAFPNAPFLSGGVSTKKLRQVEDEWNAGGHAVVLAQHSSIAHGLNLQGTRAAVGFYTLPWDLEVYDQFIRRVWRQGQTERVLVYRFVAEGTIDEAVVRALDRKDRVQQALFYALQETAKERRSARKGRR